MTVSTSVIQHTDPFFFLPLLFHFVTHFHNFVGYLCCAALNRNTIIQVDRLSHFLIFRVVLNFVGNKTNL